MFQSMCSLACLGALAGVQAAPQQALPTTTSVSSPQSSISAGTVCNNSPDLCDKSYNEVTYLGAHNIAFLRDESTDFTISGNHYYNATMALDAGLRLMQSQTHTKNGKLHLCHSSCDLLDAGPLEDWLKEINDWMDKNENEVVTILLVNGDDNKASSQAYKEAYEASGIDKHAWGPAVDTRPLPEWPTLGSMITSGKRLVSFVTRIQSREAANYLLNEFSYVFETPYENRELSDFKCNSDRPSKASPATTAIQEGWLSLVNHFKYDNVIASFDVPDVDSIGTINNSGTSSAGNLGKHIQECEQAFGRAPNFVLVDFWSEGDPIKAVDQMNGISAVEGRSETDLPAPDENSAAITSAVHLGCAALLASMASAMFLV